MDSSAFWKMVELGKSPKAQEKTIEYLTEHLSCFLRERERVMICFLEHKEGNLSWLMEQAVIRCDAEPVIWGPDHRWKTLLQQAFLNKTTAIIGPPLILLGLAKLKRQSGTPLYIRRCITAGYPCQSWMVEGITRGFDCKVSSCFSIAESNVVVGFACERGLGVHLRESEYGVTIADENGSPLPQGEMGEVVLHAKAAPHLYCRIGDAARLITEKCACGCTYPRLVDISPASGPDVDLDEFRQYLQSWTSVLDCRVQRGENGLEIEIVCFAGEKLPKLPPAAMRIIRPWNPMVDEPFWFMPTF